MIRELHEEIVNCARCSRLREHCAHIAQVKRRAYMHWNYWGKPVPSFGDPAAQLLIVGLAPGAHGANRTGRMFTGDSSGEWLYRALFETGFASQPTSLSADDGLVLRNAYITASAHCAPPDNKPSREEIEACRPFLQRELELLRDVRVVVCLGRIAFDNYLAVRGLRRAQFVFEHNRLHDTAPPLISSYHPSQQNTSTGKLTREMLSGVFERARQLLLLDAKND